MANIAEAGKAWAHRRPCEVTELVNRLERAAAVVFRLGDRHGDITGHIKRITPIVVDLTSSEQTPKSMSTLSAIAEGGHRSVTAAGLDVDCVGVCVATVPPAPAPRFAAVLDAEI